MGLEPQRHRIEVVKDIILRVFYFLESHYNYAPVCWIENSRTFIEYLNVEYISEVKYRKIRIGYTMSNVYGEIKYTLNGSITRMPYSDLNDYFSLSNYLGSIEKDFSTSLVNDFNEENAENVLTIIAIALREHALSIVEGKMWLDNYYPRKD